MQYTVKGALKSKASQVTKYDLFLTFCPPCYTRQRERGEKAPGRCCRGEVEEEEEEGASSAAVKWNTTERGGGGRKRL